MLDTCALLWLGGSPERLTAGTRAMIAGAQILYASPVSVWEIALKHRFGKLKLSLPPTEWIAALRDAYGFSFLPLDSDVMLRAAQLPFFHRDPADRFIIATAQIHSLDIVTADRRFAQYGVNTLD
ncbi:MAG: type II toxin-antitoxin system VapC family toxin [Victivallales bacterium]|nr:type II toxin-antitoxin system VapC family toxin [Victivallales bacterium]